MRPSLPILFFSALCVAPSQAATVTAFGATVSTYVSDNSPPTLQFDYTAVDPTSPSLTPSPFESEQLADFQGNGGNAETLARLENLSYSIPDGAGTFAYSATDFGVVSVMDDSKAASPNAAKIDIGATAEYSFSFTLAPGETKLANFDFTYSIIIDNDVQNTANVYWELLAPDTARSAIYRADTYMNDPLMDPVDETIIVDQSAILDQAGTYTFVLRAEIPNQEFQNSKKDVIITLDDVLMEVTNIPEPSSTSLVMLGGCIILLRRQRG